MEKKFRYIRNIRVIGEDGQERLSSSSVFIVGCGALGGQIAMLLAGAGIGKIGIADFDTIDISNLQRQLFFSESEAGKSKVSQIAERMHSLNSEIEIIQHSEIIRESNGYLLKGYDILIDASDNPTTKYLLDDLAKKMGAGLCSGGVSGWKGQVVTLANNKPDAMKLSDIFPFPSSDSSMLPCEINGVMGPAASAIASIEASEVVQSLLLPKQERFSRLISIDLSNPFFSSISF